MTIEAQQANNPFGIPEADEGTKVERDVFGLRKQYKRIVIYEDRAPGAETVCKVGVNGRTFLLKRGVEHIVSVDVVHVLDNAVEEVLVQGEGQIITRPALRFPYQDRGTVTESEYRAYQEKMRKEQQARAQQAVAA